MLSQNFIKSTKDLINRHGVNALYIQQEMREYDVELSAVDIKQAEYEVKVYRKDFTANKYNYPALVGKQTCWLYLAGDVEFMPAVKDRIELNDKKFSVQQIVNHDAAGATVLYKLLCVS